MRFRSCLLLLLLLPAFVSAEPVVSLDVEPRAGSLDDSFVMRITVQGAAELKYPELSGGDEFDIVLIGPEQQVKIVNGTVEQSTSFVYRLEPKNTGTLQSPGASLLADGHELHVAPVEISVAAGSPAPTVDQRLDEVFIRQFTDQNRIHVGEQLVYVLQIFQRVRVESPQLSGTTMDGVWQEDLGEEKRSSTIVDGHRYDVTTLRKAFFPLAPGEYKLPPATLTGQIPVRTGRRQRSPFPPDIFGAPFDFDDFFGMTRMREITLTPERPSITVVPLPSPPPDFFSWGQGQPLVGETALTVSYDPSAIGIGDSKTIQLTIESRGNLRPLVEPQIAQDHRFRVYQDKPEFKYEVRGNGTVFQKIFHFTVVPSSGGTIEIPPLRLGFFDPKTEQYRTAVSEPIKFSVKGPVSAAEPVAEKDTAEQPIGAAEEPAPLRYAEPTLIERVAREFSLSLVLLILSLVGLLAMAFALRKIRSGRVDLKAQSLAEIHRVASTQELAQLFKDYLRLRISGAGSHHSTDALRGLAERKVEDPNLKADVLLTLDALDEAVYSKLKIALPAFEQLRQRVVGVIERW